MAAAEYLRTYPPLRPEMELLVACARIPFNEPHAQRVASLLRPDLDWEYVRRTAARHGVLPLFWWHLNQRYRNAVPTNLAGSMRMWFRQNLQRNLKLTAELLRLLHLLNENDICALAFKGPVLTASLYGNLALRQFVDLDLLMRRADVLRAKALLQAEGYESPLRLSERQERAYLGSQCEHHLYAPGGLFQVELHWQILARFHGFSFDTEGWWQRRRHVNLHEIEVPTLSPEDELLALCVHGQKHCWSRLIWISDLAQLLAAHSDLAWDQITHGARELSAERVLRLGLHLAHNLLQAPLPEA
ncbi:MAG: nucleotidyltransferase family protein, partial [Acidobacteria bacterium]|nr:nucleotidyltransferase family protein [Acidobacteriota bacterium]